MCVAAIVFGGVESLCSGTVVPPSQLFGFVYTGYIGTVCTSPYQVHESC